MPNIKRQLLYASLCVVFNCRLSYFVVQIPSISSDAGGALGLLLGLCGFNIVEMIVMVYDLLRTKMPASNLTLKKNDVGPTISGPSWDTRSAAPEN